jgi:signal transduction histidine kinase
VTAPPPGRRGSARSLRFRITALAALAVLAVLTVAGIGLTVTHRAILTDGLDQSIGDRADAIAARLAAGQRVQTGDLPGDDVLVQVVDDGGRVVAASPGLAGARLSPASPAHTTVGDGTLPNGGAARVLATPAGTLTVYVVGSLEDVERSTATLVRSLLVAVPVSAAVLAAVVWWLVGRVLRPVEDIRAEVEGISAARLDRRVPVPATGDEIARLAHTMNAMLDRLAGAAERQRRFVADAAHEMRSPLARIRTDLEVDAAHPEVADLHRTHAAVLGETVDLQRLVDDLLLLARSDAGALDVSRAGLVDLDDVVEAVALTRRPQTDRRIDTRGVVPVQVDGDRPQLERAVANLLDNAARHARDRVTVTLGTSGGQAVLAVADDGPGIPPESADVVFERFTRLDEARSASDGGAGLGLPIARQIAERHGGTLTLSPGEWGARFVLTLPLPP